VFGQALTTRPNASPEYVADATAEDLRVRFLLSLGSDNTRAAYGGDLRDWGTWLAERDLDPLAVARAHVDAYARDLERRGRGPATIARRLATLAGYYRYAVDEDVLARSPVDRVRRPRAGGDSPTQGLDRDELRCFLAAADSCKVSSRDRALVELLSIAALRVSEALGANVGDIGSERGHCTLRVTGKGGQRWTVVLPPRVCDAVDAMLAERENPPTDGPLFMTRTGRRLSRFEAAAIVARVARLAGIMKRISPHSLRHSAITAALDAGAPLRDVQDYARHADPRTTRRYDRGRHNLDRNAAYKVAAFIAQ
jgi:integrase/recombinase XerD